MNREEGLSEAQLRARDYINGVPLKADDARKLLASLIEEGSDYWIRRYLEKATGDAALADKDFALVASRELARSSYTDDQLTASADFAAALSQLARLDVPTVEALAPDGDWQDGDWQNVDTEDLSIAGDLHQTRWRHTDDHQLMHHALRYYELGARALLEPHAVVAARDAAGRRRVIWAARCALQAAFLRDRLGEIADGWAHRSHARRHRHRVAVALAPKELGIPGGLEPGTKRTAVEELLAGEALFGLGQWAGAAARFEAYGKAPPVTLDGALDIPVRRRDVEATARRLARTVTSVLADVGSDQRRSEEKARAHQAIQSLIDAYRSRRDDGQAGGPDIDPAKLEMGRVGLALSGGGFRASFYHVGVLAALAERDVLRHVEVLSCVSGGSIIGAHYYLALKAELERPENGSRGIDYVDLVVKVANTFFDGVAKNLRSRLYANPWHGIRSAGPHGNRTNRLGHLFEHHLFAQAAEGTGLPDWNLEHLKVGSPEGELDPGDNWLRTDKIPQLVINATTLNTGHSWQFTASWMGEPPSAVDGDVDSNERLRRLYHGQRHHRAKPVTLGTAVAASAAVPGAFPPVELRGYYDDRTIALVDGGVHDNQGIAALLESDSRVVIVSDASGQMPAQPRSARSRFGVINRTIAVYGHGLRTAQFREMRSRAANKLIRHQVWVHLKQGLPIDPVNWTGMPDGASRSDKRLTEYGINIETQRLVADLRTDLDSFTEVEASALMWAGYASTMRQLGTEEMLELFPKKGDCTWSFEDLAEPMSIGTTASAERERLDTLLEAGQGRFWRLLSINGPLKALRNSRAGRVVTALVLVAVALAAFWSVRSVTVPAFGLVAALVFLLVSAVAVLVPRKVGLGWVVRSIGELALSFVLWPPFLGHLLVTDPLYRRAGTMARLLGHRPRSDVGKLVSVKRAEKEDIETPSTGEPDPLEPLITFDESKAHEYRPLKKALKTAVRIDQPAEDVIRVNPSFESTQPQLVHGPAYAVADEDSSYLVPVAEFTTTHRRTANDALKWEKVASVWAYQAEVPGRLETYKADGVFETAQMVKQGDWIVRQVTGEVQMIPEDRFEDLYETAPADE